MIRSPAIAAIVAAFIALDAELAALGSNETVATYRSDGPLPPRTSRVTFNRACASGAVVGAAKIGGRGRGLWSCTREAWHASRARPTAPALRLVECAPTDDAARARAMLADAGFRLTARGSR